MCCLLDCDYEEDPSNHNCQFERVQMRQFLRNVAASGALVTDDALRLGCAMQVLSDHLDLASSTLWQGATRLFPTGHAMINMIELSDLAQTAWAYRARHLIRQIGGRPYGVSDLAVTGLRERLLAGRNWRPGGCQFVKSLRHREPDSFYVVRELGRASGAVDVMIDDDVILQGAGGSAQSKLGSLCMLARS